MGSDLVLGQEKCAVAGSLKARFVTGGGTQVLVEVERLIISAHHMERVRNSVRAL